MHKAVCVYTTLAAHSFATGTHTYMHCGAPLCVLVCAYTAKHVFKTPTSAGAVLALPNNTFVAQC